ncbi:hypothetical protein [Mangrovihabitans endophyticus]|uniref:Homeodomain-like domain-containing protein n=2 Tax=Mangrovihabitans endophyticus TaxID=1751298 RepID=A0A8J3BU72_9ACTN|nr:hypothetical protein [Mangrovihabitans endophyticus]GGK70265.1 hypothetical protein GCM10012284_00130 [Mangrovihabitans endophyticus]
MLSDLAGIAAARADLDRRELDLIDRARRAGATWGEIAAVLGLTSRQAAEQRRGRLAASTARAAATRRRDADRRHGLTELRSAVGRLDARITADSRWDRRFVRAALTRATVAAAVQAPPGAMFALVAQAMTDIAGSSVWRLPAPLAAALADVRDRLRDASPPPAS